MCGIAGLFLPKGAAPLQADMNAMMLALVHRGPDGEGRYVSEDRRYQAGFRRLAIIDLETGDQPIIDGGRGRVLTGNGEIYNYLEICEAHADYPRQTRGDMEAVLALHAAKGDAFVDDLNGMYGLALYEGGPHRLTLVRDRLGIKPLYWAEVSGGGILYASEIKALFASGLVSAAVDEDAVGAYLVQGYVPSPATLYKGIHQLPPGHRLTTDADGTFTVERYWRPQAANDLPTNPDDIAGYLTDLLSDSVRLQLRSDVPVGALLSGGIDSGLMVALAAEHSVHPVNTFTVRFEGAAFDESPLAEEVARRYATKHTTLDLPSSSVGDHLLKLAWHADAPLADPALLPNFLIEQALGQNLKVALNGTGGDELFAGYMRYFQKPVESGYLMLPGFMRRMIENMVPPMTAWKLARAEKFNRDPGAYLNGHTTQFATPMLDLIGWQRPIPAAAQSAFADAFQGPRQSKMLAADINTYLEGNLLGLLDRASMAVGVEGRVPFLDHRLVEAALAVPPEIRTPGGIQKGLARTMARPYLPESVLNAPKRGFASPVSAWMVAGLGAVAGRILSSSRALERGWWTKNGIERLLSDPGRHAFRIYQLLMLELSVSIHVEGRAGEGAPSGSLEDFADVG